MSFCTFGMPRHVRRLVVLTLITAFLQGCGGKDSKSLTTFTFRVANASGLTVSEVYLTTGGSWGANQISSQIPPGGVRDIGGVSPCATTFNYYARATNGTLWGPSSSMMPACGGTFTLTLT